MSNPLILHGAKVPLPRPRAPQLRPMPTVPEDDSNLQQKDLHTAETTAATTVLSTSSPTQPCATQPSSALQSVSPRKASALANRGKPSQSASASAAVPDAQLSTDQLRLKLRMQSTIQAYSGNPSAAIRHRRNNLVTSTLPSAIYRRTNSSPIRSRLLGRNQSESRRTTTDCSSSCHSSSTCSSAAPAGDEADADPRRGAGGQGGHPQRAIADRDRSLLQTKSLLTNRGLPQVRGCLISIRKTLDIRRFHNNKQSVYSAELLTTLLASKCPIYNASMRALWICFTGYVPALVRKSSVSYKMLPMDRSLA